ncbi:MAG: hypothetical protein R3C11_25195 [Planctomycetaceae bacterium]
MESPVSSGGKKAKSKAAKPAKAAKSKPAAVSMADLSEDEQKQRKQVAWIVLSWSFIGGVLLDNFVLKPYVLPDFLKFGYIPTVGTVVLFVMALSWAISTKRLG